jgi:hypothetical protein
MPYGLLGLANLDTRHKHESESVRCEAHHVRNPIAIQGPTLTISMGPRLTDVHLARPAAPLEHRAQRGTPV